MPELLCRQKQRKVRRQLMTLRRMAASLSTARAFAGLTCWRFASCGVLLAGLVGVFGCSRGHYRKQADQDAACLLSEKGGYLDHGQVYAAPGTRLYDPFAADCPPLPPDDPQSHQLMHCVDGKRGWDHHRNGHANVEATSWLETLDLGPDGTLELSLRDAIGVARANSREYQENLETLYLSALDVSFERFRFDHQFFGGNRSFQEFRGRDVGASSQLGLNTFASTQKLSATGGEFVVGFANSLVWDFWGTDTDLLSSTLDFSLVQPLLRFGGRARVLEQLTQTERNLLANVRQMEQFRQGFFVSLATGRNSGSGPSANGRVGQTGLGLIAGNPGGRSGAPGAGGYLGLLEDQQEIRNQAGNITALRDSLAQLEAAFQANRIPNRLQVDQARQALLNAQSSLLSSRAAYETRVDAYKLTLGLPPSMSIEIKDPFLNQFVLIDPNLTDIQDDLSELLLRIQKGRKQPSAEFVSEIVRSLDQLDAPTSRQFEAATVDLVALDARLPLRLEQLAGVANKVAILEADVDSRVYDQDLLRERAHFLKRRLPELEQELRLVQATRREIDALNGDANVDRDELWKQLNKCGTDMSDVLLELSLLNAEANLQGITLLPLEISPVEALDMARINRLDWMNARANLVDVWRRIEFVANELESDLDLVLDGSLGTDPDHILRFDKNNSRLRFGMRFDTPTARLAERNRYREALVNYQRARRDYMLFEDRISQSLRNTIRIVDLAQINLEVRRAAVQVAISQVDIARLRLNPPLRPGQESRPSPTAARDLVSALTDLLDAQNDFLNVWVSYEVLRILLDFEMGTIRLDPQGVWLDPAGERSTFRQEPVQESNALDGGELDLQSSETRLSVDGFRLPGPIQTGMLQTGKLQTGKVQLSMPIELPTPQLPPVAHLPTPAPPDAKVKSRIRATRPPVSSVIGRRSNLTRDLTKDGKLQPSPIPEVENIFQSNSNDRIGKAIDSATPLQLR